MLYSQWKHVHPDLDKLVKSVQIHKHRKTREKTKSARCPFEAPWPPSDKTLIVSGTNFSKGKQGESKAILDQVLLKFGRPDISELTSQNVLDESGITKDQYDNAQLHFEIWKQELMKSTFAVGCNYFWPRFIRGVQCNHPCPSVS